MKILILGALLVFFILCTNAADTLPFLASVRQPPDRLPNWGTHTFKLEISNPSKKTVYVCKEPGFTYCSKWFDKNHKFIGGTGSWIASDGPIRSREGYGIKINKTRGTWKEEMINLPEYDKEDFYIIQPGEKIEQDVEVYCDIPSEEASMLEIHFFINPISMENFYV